MKIVKRILDYKTPWELPDVYLFTGNKVINHRGKLIMGAGAARDVRDYYPDTPKEFGRIIRLEPDKNVVFTVVADNQSLGWFQVKKHWNDQADLKLIEKSVQELTAIADEPYAYTFHMNFPGIGNGGLKIDEVMPVVESLPDNVILYVDTSQII